MRCAERDLRPARPAHAFSGAADLRWKPQLFFPRRGGVFLFCFWEAGGVGLGLKNLKYSMCHPSEFTPSLPQSEHLLGCLSFFVVLLIFAISLVAVRHHSFGLGSWLIKSPASLSKPEANATNPTPKLVPDQRRTNSASTSKSAPKQGQCHLKPSLSHHTQAQQYIS